MHRRNKFFKKKWDSASTKNYLFYFYTRGLKSNKERKFRRICKHNQIKMWALPSSFIIDSLFYAQGPNVAAVSATNMSYALYKSLLKIISTTFFERKKAYPTSFLTGLEKTEKSQDFCTNFCLCFNEYISKSENFEIDKSLS